MGDIACMQVACSRPSVSGSVQRAADERGKMRTPPLLPLSNLKSLDVSLTAVFVCYHQSRAWNRLAYKECSVPGSKW